MEEQGSKIQIYRNKLYKIFTKRKDAVMNLLDALTCHGLQCKSVVQLSNSNWFKRKYSSITDAITDGLSKINWDQAERLTYNSVEKKLQKIYFLLTAHQILGVIQMH